LILGKLPSPFSTGNPVRSLIIVTPRVQIMLASSVSSSVVRSRRGTVEFLPSSARLEFAVPQWLMGTALALPESQACGHRALAV
jgi:hypothetical protein